YKTENQKKNGSETYESTGHTRRVSLDDRKMEDIIEFEKAEVEKYLNSQKLKDSESTDGRIKTTNEILQDMNKRMEIILQDMNKRMDIMQTQMKKLAKKIK
ncbi:hypothetical protein DPMN_041080, partial [Dreissena polymorpha]